jgi:hypothetical protein
MPAARPFVPTHDVVTPTERIPVRKEVSGRPDESWLYTAEEWSRTTTPTQWSEVTTSEGNGILRFEDRPCVGKGSHVLASGRGATLQIR